MNILPFIPKGWLTNIGVAIKVVAGLLGLLQAIQGGDIATIANSLEGVVGLYAIGAGVAAAGIRRALGRIENGPTIVVGSSPPVTIQAGAAASAAS